jgi:hypothetical protein
MASKISAAARHTGTRMSVSSCGVYANLFSSTPLIKGITIRLKYNASLASFSNNFSPPDLCQTKLHGYQRQSFVLPVRYCHRIFVLIHHLVSIYKRLISLYV